MDKIKCIIFDCDGVLVDSEAIGIQVLLSMVEQSGLYLNLEESINTFRGMALKDCFLALEMLLNKPLPPDFEKEFRRLSFIAFRN
jgi:beta-phosphoglucomutase-like phosphatase (HAD superfamily)